ncbi:hypothetical protein [Mucilaginibacter lacusdianchii]|uniref:hypothetical protein n=1 Tax=Mucilaginibacter lacusdianchii TaxID=2684211 RepID=UPI00131AA2DD|nr:hypothetical protein [Mucilaginibacter sp. JXJ CY 39]
MKQAFMYSLKVWITTACLGPFVTGIVLIITDPLIYRLSDLADASMVYTIIAGLFVCGPAYALTGLIVYFLLAKLKSVKRLKVSITFITTAIVLLSFAIVDYHALINSNYWPSLLPWLACYYAVTVAGIWFYKVEPYKQTVEAIEHIGT